MPDLLADRLSGLAPANAATRIERAQAELADALSRHDRAALHVSGGKDSLTCLHLARPWWDRITVMWANTGAAFPEALALMEDVRAMVPHFIEVKNDVVAQIARDGPPTDLLPVWNTPMGRAVHSGRDVPIQFPFTCCAENIWGPMARATAELGVSLIIRGQRARELRKAPIASGCVENGIEYLFPIEDWSGDQVREYLAASGVPLPANYTYTDTSMDCWCCTAFLDENVPGKYRNMREQHPALYARVQRQFDIIAAELRRELEVFTAARQP